MQALMKVASGPGNLELRDIAEPVAGPGEVVVRVAATGICGSDLHIQDDEYQVDPPVVIGHETAGTVVATGTGVTDIRSGQRVTSRTTISTCGACSLCRAGRTNLCPQRRWLGGHVNGGFAGAFVVPQANILPLPDAVSFDAAALTEPLACCVHGVLELARPALVPPPGAAGQASAGRFSAGTLAVVSGPGPIGLLCAQVARAAGAEVIILGTGADAGRFALARRLGFERLVDVQADDPLTAVGALGAGREPDLIIEAAGAGASLEGCLRLVRRGGVVLQIGLYGRPVPVALDTLVLKEVRLLGSFSSTPTAWPTAIDLLARGAVQAEPLVTSKRPLAEWAAAFDAARGKSEGKILLTP